MNKLSIFQKNYIFTFVLLVFAFVLIFAITFNIQRHLLINNIVEQSEGIGETWVNLMTLQDIKIGTYDFDIQKSHNKNLINQLTFLTENNKNIAQAYLFSSKISKDNKTIIMAQPQSILEKGVKVGDLYKQPDEWVKSARILIQEKKSVNTKVYTDVMGTWLTTLHPIIDENGEVIAILGIDMDASILKEGQQQLFTVLILSLSVLLVLTLYLQFLGMNKINKPLKELFLGIRRIANSDYNETIKIEADNEIKEASEVVNDILIQLNVVVSQIRQTINTIKNNSHFLLHETSLENNHLSLSKNLLSNKKILELMSELKDIESLSLLNLELEHSARLQTISQLAAAVSHEVKNPVTTVRGFLQMFIEDNSLSDKKEFVELMIKELDSILKTIDNYSIFAKPNNNRLEEIVLKDLIIDIVSLMLSNSNKVIEIKIEIDSSLKIYANKIEMNEVFLNLIKNGIEAIDEYGSIIITGGKEGDNAIVEVKDSGIGMTIDEIQRLGTPYYSTKTIGTGLGLMTVYHIIRKMKGKIEVISELKKGTTFRIKFPR